MLDTVFHVLLINIIIQSMIYSLGRINNSFYSDNDYEKTTIKRFKRLFLFGKKDKYILKFCYLDQAIAICILLFTVIMTFLYLAITNFISHDIFFHKVYAAIGLFCVLAGILISTANGLIAHVKAYKKRRIDEKKHGKRPNSSSREFMQILRALQQTKTDIEKEKADKAANKDED